MITDTMVSIKVEDIEDPLNASLDHMTLEHLIEEAYRWISNPRTGLSVIFYSA